MLDLTKSSRPPTLDPDQRTKRRKLEDAVLNCELKLPEEVAALFLDYTRWIWEYKCLGAIHKYYCDHTIFHGENGYTAVGADAIVASSLQAVCAYPDQIVDFVDIIVEGNEEDGYNFGQSSRLGLYNNGWSASGPPTGKWAGVGDVPLYSICELKLKKIEGRWRVAEEWVVEGTEVKRQVLSQGDADNDVVSTSDKDTLDCAVKAASDAAKAAAEAALAASTLVATINGAPVDMKDA
jgi:hypothetical protein